MKKKTEKSPEQRARELFKIVYSDFTTRAFDRLMDHRKLRWLKLARYVLALEKKLKKKK